MTWILVAKGIKFPTVLPFHIVLGDLYTIARPTAISAFQFFRNAYIGNSPNRQDVLVYIYSPLRQQLSKENVPWTYYAWQLPGHGTGTLLVDQIALPIGQCPRSTLIYDSQAHINIIQYMYRVDGCFADVLLASSGLIAFTRHLKQQVLLCDNCSGEAPYLLGHAVHGKRMVHLLADEAPIRDL